MDFNHVSQLQRTKLADSVFAYFSFPPVSSPQISESLHRYGKERQCELIRHSDPEVSTLGE